MDAAHNQVFFPAALQDLFAAWSRFPAAVPFAGGVSFARRQNSRYTLTLPANILSLDGLNELHHISRTERYIEMGAMVKLNDIINLGKIIPPVFTQALKCIAGPELRNLATIGGNICHPALRLNATAPLVALDARYELRTALAARWIAAARFSTVSGSLAFNPQELLTRIRIPLEQWNYSLFKRFADSSRENETGGSMVFIARIQKNVLTDLRIVFAGDAVIRDKNSEAVLSGKHLPLDRRDIRHFIELWTGFLSAVDTPGAMMKARMLNFVETAVMELAD
ncbi:MAG: FAD binding domain-containing protein [Spirochaetaceae bacterium]|jgi:CO/xanthine dehydrogenase FAD-binding subunit|nr:FAD binding domain-containing protein [Spirochaetaceae bacterium]